MYGGAEVFKVQELLSHPREHIKYLNNPNITSNVTSIKRNSLSSRYMNYTINNKNLNKPTSANDLIEMKRLVKEDNLNNINNINNNYSKRSISVNKNTLSRTLGVGVMNKNNAIHNKSNNIKINNTNNNNIGYGNSLKGKPKMNNAHYTNDVNSSPESPRHNYKNNNLNDNKEQDKNEKNLFNTFRNKNSNSNSKLLAIGNNLRQLPSLGTNNTNNNNGTNGTGTNNNIITPITNVGYPRDTFSSGYGNKRIPQNSNTNNINNTNNTNNTNYTNNTINPSSSFSNMFHKSFNNKYKGSSLSSTNIPDPFDTMSINMKNIERLNLKKPYTTTKLSKADSKSSIVLDQNSCIKDYSFKDEQNAPYRMYMEDYMKVTNNFMGDSSKIVFGLYDGHGGAEVAKICKDRLPEIFAKHMSDSNKNNVEIALSNSFKKLDEQLKKHENVGSTANLVYICKEDGKRVIYSANIGDSRTVLIRKKKAERLSYDHKGTDLKEIERIKISGGVVFGGRVFGQLAISRAFGDFSLKSYGVIAIPYITKNYIEDNDSYVVMGSDGIWDVIDEDFVYKISLNVNSTDEFARSIVSNAMSLGSIDNISCIVIKLN